MSPVQPDGYLAMPAAGSGRPVLVLHAWWGLNETIKQLCRRLAEAGFVAFAPDLYRGKVTDTIAGAEALSGELWEKRERARADLAAAVTFIQTQAGGSDADLTVIGFSLGAAYALELSITRPDAVRSVVVFYGTYPGDFSSASADYLGHYAEHDEYEPQAEVAALEQSLRQAGRSVTFYPYSGTGHWFFEPDREQAYDAAAAALAWERTLAFLNRAIE